MKQAAIFLDRDNTLIHDPGYLADPNQVQLLDGVPDAIRRFNEAGYKVVVVTNQSGVARGLLTEAQLDDIHAQLELLLDEHDARVDAIYYCPYLDTDEAIVSKYRRKSHLRKPAPGMLQKAAQEHDLDLEYSWMIGDSESDIQAGRAAGCRTILLSNDGNGVPADHVAPSLEEAAQIIIDGATAELAPSTIETAAHAAEAAGSTGRVAVAASIGTVAPGVRVDPELSTPDTEPTGTSPGTAPPLESPITTVAGDTDQALTLLRDIRQLLQRQQRDTAQADFSLPRLTATLFQFIAIAMLLWGFYAFIGYESTPELLDALIRFVLAGVVQLGALTLFLIDRGR